jgi:transposase
MSGISNIQIKESKATLQEMLKQEKSLRNQQRLQVLYLMQAEQMPIFYIALSIGKHRGSLHRWLEQYQEGGIEAMLKVKPKTGRPRKIPEWAVKSLEKQLETPEGFKSYTQVQKWLEITLGIGAAYRTVHELTRYRLKAKLKVARHRDRRQNTSKIAAFKKTLVPTCP